VKSRAHAHLIKKNMASAFAGTELADWLTRHEIDTLSIVGYMTHNCDASTAIHARHTGITAEFLHDASGSLPYTNGAGAATAEEIHRIFSVVFHSSFAAVSSTAQWIAAVEAKAPIARDNIVQSNLRARGLA
jgi:nicotinamidase-related amidase